MNREEKKRRGVQIANMNQNSKWGYIVKENEVAVTFDKNNCGVIVIPEDCKVVDEYIVDKESGAKICKIKFAEKKY